MENMAQVHESTYAEFKAGFDKDMHDTTEGFVKIGYRLRMAEDTDVLRESGYKSVAEFASAEYHLTKDQVSRFININKKFSEGGYSDRLKSEYSRFGFSKLAIMLTMDEEVNTAIPEQATKAEIQELSRELKEEKEITDLEVMMEPKKVELEVLENNLQRAAYAMFFEHPTEKYLPAMNALRAAGAEMKDKINAVYDALAPNGYAMSTFRIPGAGKFILTIKGKENPVEVVNVRMNDKETFTFEELVEAVLPFCPVGAADPKKAWEVIFGKEYPVSVQQEPEIKKPEAKKEEVAPVQPKEPEKKTYTAKEAAQKFAEKMAEKENVGAETQETVEKPQELEYKEPDQAEKQTMNPPEESEQLPGQTSIEKDFREYLPESMQQEQKEPEVAPVQPEKTEKQKLHEQIYSTINKMNVNVLSKKYRDTMELCHQLEHLLGHMEELQNEVPEQ